jgi:hypothetical protein
MKGKIYDQNFLILAAEEGEKDSSIKEVKSVHDASTVRTILIEKNDGFQRFKVTMDGEFCTFSTILSQLSESTTNWNLVSALNDSITRSYEGVYWECPPVKYSELNKEFEFVVLEAKSLSKREVDIEPFAAKISNAKDAIISFNNLGRDCYLIVPCPINFGSEDNALRVNVGVKDKKRLQYLNHLASFIRGPEWLATPTQHEMHRKHISQLWSTVASSMLLRLREDEGARVWMSTSGMGVSWLHVRLDRAPKYYTYLPYKHAHVDGKPIISAAEALGSNKPFISAAEKGEKDSNLTEWSTGAANQHISSHSSESKADRGDGKDTGNFQSIAHTYIH